MKKVDGIDTKATSGFSIFKLLSKAGLDSFILLLLCMIILARIYPAAGVYDGAFSLSNIASYGVSLIFFFYGLRLSPEKLRAGLSNWKLHMVVHATTFIVFPLLVLAAKSIFENETSEYLWLGIFFLASLPSTVSSAVVMVSIAGGNMAAAIFNASISSLLGVVFTPLWMSLVLTSTMGSFNLSDVIVKLFLQVLAPVIMGILLHKKWGAQAEKNKKKLKNFDQTIILIIVYTSFCESFAQNMFAQYSLVDIVLLGLSMTALFFVVFILVGAICKLLKFNREDTITAVFCGSKKSLVHGTVMSEVLFAGSKVTGIILLPLMLYHALQLIAASIIAQQYAKRREKEEATATVGLQ